MRKKLKICHVITRMIVGGAQENTLLTIIGHILKGHEVTLVTGPSPGPEGELLANKDFPEFEIVENPWLVRELNPVKDLKAYFTLKKFFTERGFDVVHTHSSKAGIVGRVAAYKANVPFVTHTVHGQAFHRNEKVWKNCLYIHAERFAAKYCHKIYAVAQAMIDQCVEAGVAPADKYKVVYSGMDIDKFLNSTPEAELKAQLGIPDKVKVIGTVARLFPLKGYEQFIPAAAEILKQRPDTHFLIVGNGIMLDDIKAQIKTLGIADKFSFAGLVPPDQVYRYIALMDILVHLSLREGLPRSVVQALASGKPAVAYHLDGTPEVVINGETGFTLEPESIEQVTQSCLKILDDPALAEQMSSKCKDMVRSKFDWRVMANVLEEEYYRHLGL
ncbi:MAG: glycosyltransferase family 4 protein [Victivallales bacterium]|nr:glycosyltransferase family 4 protein [Victivallales bacterium]